MTRAAWTTAALLAALLLACHIAFDPFLTPLRGKTFDIYQTALPGPAVTTPIILVEIDEESLNRNGRWPWNRATVADLVDAVAAAGATAIGIDILFPEPDTGPDGASGDRALSETLSRAPSVLSVSTSPLASSTRIEPKAGWSLVGDVPERLPAVGGIISSMPSLSNAASGLGIIRATPDYDNTLRQLPLIWLQGAADRPQIWPSFALELARIYLGASGITARMTDGVFDALKLDQIVVPLDAAGRINLRERYGSLPALSAAHLLSGGAAPELKGSIAIIAVSATGLDRYHTTPAQVARFGAEIHGMIIEQILLGDFILEPPNAKWVERGWFAVAVVLVLIFAGMISTRPVISVLALLALIASPFAAAMIAFAARGELYESLQPATGLLLVALTAGFANYRVAEQRRRNLTRQFSQFLSPTIVSKLAASDAQAMIAVEKREITVLIMDIRGFTAMTHTLAAGQIVTVVNHFLAIATDEILKRDGTIDKFMGDAVLAIWNAPIAVHDHADRALAAAETIISRVAHANSTLEAQDLPPLRVGAGLETGICSVGNFGSVRRIDYTAIGDTVNLASRLEGATKTVSPPLLAGPGFAASISQPMVSVGRVKLQGFDEEVEAFTTSVFAEP